MHALQEYRPKDQDQKISLLINHKDTSAIFAAAVSNLLTRCKANDDVTNESRFD